MKNLLITPIVLTALVAAMALFAPSEAQAACGNAGDSMQLCTGTGTNDNDILFTTNGVDRYDACMLMSHDGAVDVEGSLDGTNYSSALALEDRSATSTDKVLVTTADGMFAVVGTYRFLRVRQNGATATAATMLCWDRGR